MRIKLQTLLLFILLLKYITTIINIPCWWLGRKNYYHPPAIKLNECCDCMEIIEWKLYYYHRLIVSIFKTYYNIHFDDDRTSWIFFQKNKQFVCKYISSTALIPTLSILWLLNNFAGSNLANSHYFFFVLYLIYFQCFDLFSPFFPCCIGVSSSCWSHCDE